MKTKRNKKSILIQDVISTMDAHDREVLSLQTVDQNGKKATLEVPFTNGTRQRLQETAKILLGRQFEQKRPEITITVAKKTASFEDIWPYDALLALTHNRGNRALKLDHVETLAHKIRTGAWETTCQGIGFDVDGNLSNGQHTLWGCIMADAPLNEALVVRGLPQSAKDKTDIVAVRSNGCLLELNPGSIKLNELPPANSMNAILFRIFMLVAGKHKNLWQGSRDNLASMIAKYEPAMKWLKTGGYLTTRGISRHFTKAPILAALVLAYSKSPKKTKKFADIIFKGSMDERENTSPAIRSFYEYLDAGSRSNKALVCVDSVLVQTYRALRALKAYFDNETTEDVCTKGFPKSTDGREALVAYFAPQGDKRNLMPSEIDLDSFDTMMGNHAERLRDLTQEQLARDFSSAQLGVD